MSHSPHDTLFRYSFGHAAHAASWLRAVVPTELREFVDWGSLRPLHERLHVPALPAHVVDVAFAAERRDVDGALLVLVEHKSYRDPGLDHQVLRYAVLLQRAHQRRHGSIPDVLTVVLQHGTNHASPPSQGGPFTSWQPKLPYVLDDLGKVKERELARRGMTPLAELSLRCLAELSTLSPDEVPTAFERWQDLLRAVDRADAPPRTPPMGPDAVATIGWYALAVTDVTAEVLNETFSRILHRPEDTIMSTLERTYQKGLRIGEAKGMAEGKAEGRAETILRVLEKRFAPLPDGTAYRVRGGTASDLDRWTDRMLDAATLDDVFA